MIVDTWSIFISGKQQIRMEVYSGCYIKECLLAEENTVNHGCSKTRPKPKKSIHNIIKLTIFAGRRHFVFGNAKLF